MYGIKNRNKRMKREAVDELKYYNGFFIETEKDHETSQSTQPVSEMRCE
jgi:hypothetical protein